MESPSLNDPTPNEPKRAGPILSPAFWITVILIVVAVAALPKLIKARTITSKNACIANLKQIDGAVQQWALENKKLAGDPVNFPDAVQYLKGGKPPICPDGGSYSAGSSVSDPPRCSLGSKSAAHRLP